MYTIEFKEKVYNCYKVLNHTGNEVTRIFGISQQTLFNWVRIKETTGFQPDKRTGNNHKIDDDLLYDYVLKNPCLRQKDYKGI